MDYSCKKKCPIYTREKIFEKKGVTCTVSSTVMRDCPYIPDHSNHTRWIYKMFTHKYSILIMMDLKLDLRVLAQTSHSKWPSLISCYQFNSKLMKN